MSAKRILLLGDPQQLPQVTQGIHPAPVDGSELGYIIGTEAVLPEDYGYFLAESRRMDAALAAPLSALAYEGQLRLHACTIGRRLEGVAPGLHPVPVQHSGNARACQMVCVSGAVSSRRRTDCDHDEAESGA